MMMKLEAVGRAARRRYFRRLCSGGMARRALARAIALEPDLIIDEGRTFVGGRYHGRSGVKLISGD
ncbi:hypothetical protein KCP78_16210 [Salmonella enterica subsp. enterica]|nr:hypothetical protein KCP78_16210 [Salmonella enterica subsp. enterica]